MKIKITLETKPNSRIDGIWITNAILAIVKTQNKENEIISLKYDQGEEIDPAGTPLFEVTTGEVLE